MQALFTEPLTIERISVAIADLPLPLDGTTLVQLSDFHFDGESLSKHLLEEAIAHCNDIYPDLVVLTGDFITDEVSDIFALSPYLGTLKSRWGIYAILGNHDSRRIWMRQIVQRSLAAANITPLWNEIVYPLGEALPLVGLADYYSRECRPATVLSPLPPTTPRIVLAHNPDTLDSIRPHRADLVLSGHTHGGQVQIPGLGALPSLVGVWARDIPHWARAHIPFLRKDCDRVVKHWEWVSGLHTVDQYQLYVNRGLGSYFPGRFRCPPELTVITLVCP